jgi:fused signal recognition particle receptor
MSETEPEKKGWFARFRSRGTPAVETPKPAEPEVEKTEPVEPAVAAEPETQVAPSPSEPVQTAPQPETALVEAVAEKEPEVEKPEAEKKGWLSRLRDGLCEVDQARHREHHRPLHQEEARSADARTNSRTR